MSSRPLIALAALALGGAALLYRLGPTSAALAPGAGVESRPSSAQPRGSASAAPPSAIPSAPRTSALPEPSELEPLAQQSFALEGAQTLVGRALPPAGVALDERLQVFVLADSHSLYGADWLPHDGRPLSVSELVRGFGRRADAPDWSRAGVAPSGDFTLPIPAEATDFLLFVEHPFLYISHPLVVQRASAGPTAELELRRGGRLRVTAGAQAARAGVLRLLAFERGSRPPIPMFELEFELEPSESGSCRELGPLPWEGEYRLRHGDELLTREALFVLAGETTEVSLSLP